MKKILSLLVITIFLLSFSSCSQSRNISSFKIITACFAEKGQGQVKYSFYVSEPSGAKGEESSGKVSAKLCSITAPDFETALDKFEESLGKYELTHMSAFFADSGYLSEYFYNDREAIWQHVRVSPLVKFFIIGQGSGQIADSIGKSYSYSPKSFVESSWRNERKNLLCTMSEMTFALENPIYTASIPVVRVSEENSLLVSDAMVLYNVNKGMDFVIDEDYRVFSSHIMTYGKTSKALNISLSQNGVAVGFSPGVKSKEKIVKLAEKYISQGLDFLNVSYYSKKLFPDYYTYYDYIESKNHSFVKFK